MPPSDLTMMFTLHVLGVLAGVSLTREADEGQSDAAAYVSFLGQRLDNHSYVDWDNVGSDESNSVQCRTQLHACCSRFQGLGRGDWYAPGGVKLNFVSGDGGYQSREPQRVDIRYDKKHPVMSGVYRCDIATNTPRGLMMQKIYIGLYSGNSGEFLHTVEPLKMNTDHFVHYREVDIFQSQKCIAVVEVGAYFVRGSLYHYAFQ